MGETSSSVDPVTQRIVKGLGSFCLSIRGVNFIPRPVPLVSVRRVSAAAMAVVPSLGLLGEEESLAPCGPLKTVRNLFPEHTLPTPPGTHPTQEPPRNAAWIGPLKGCSYGSSQDATSSSKHLDLTEFTGDGHADIGNALPSSRFLGSKHYKGTKESSKKTICGFTEDTPRDSQK